jgi:putative ubiquitin-RnfH superfamily antitoxin RatB of RatAB toxin-antitoxin module
MGLDEPVPAEPAVAMLQVEVAYSPAPRTVQLVPLRLPAGATVQQALQASGLGQAHPEIDWAAQPVGIWGRAVQPGEPLQDGDRVEVYRGLRVDPMEARRQRYRAQGERGRAGKKKRA